MTITTGVGGCSAILHLLVQYPKVAACAAILGLGGTYSLTSEQAAACDTAIAQCQPETPPAPPPPSIDACEAAPQITRDDLFQVTGTPFYWRNAGADPVRGNDPGPYLEQLQFSSAEQAEFLQQIEQGDHFLDRLQNGDSVGLSTSGSGKLSSNTIVAYDPLPQTGDDHTRDDRVHVYTYDQRVILDGECVTRRVTLLEPLVCQNWSRPADIIIRNPE